MSDKAKKELKFYTTNVNGFWDDINFAFLDEDNYFLGKNTFSDITIFENDIYYKCNDGIIKQHFSSEIINDATKVVLEKTFEIPNNDGTITSKLIDKYDLTYHQYYEHKEFEFNYNMVPALDLGAAIGNSNKRLVTIYTIRLCVDELKQSDGRGFSLLIPDTSTWHTPKTIATLDDIPPETYILELSGIGGELTPEDYSKVLGKNCIIRHENKYYYKAYESSESISYKYITNSGIYSDSIEVYGDSVTITKSTRVYSIITMSSVVDKTSANPTLDGGENELTSIKIGSTKYKIPDGMQVVELTGSAGTLSDADFTKVSGDNCIIKYNNNILYKYIENSLNVFIRYASIPTAGYGYSGDGSAYFVVSINTTNKTFTCGQANIVSPPLSTEYPKIINEIVLGDDTYKIYNFQSITYGELVTLRNNSELIPGRWYRITDYVCSTAQKYTGIFQPAGQFDIVVLALTSSCLEEEAYVMHHEGDVYFANCKLEAWKIKYCLDNDTSRFEWADRYGIYVQESVSNRPLYYRYPEGDVSNKQYSYCWIRYGYYEGAVDKFGYTATDNPTTSDKIYSSSTGETSYDITSIRGIIGTGVIYNMVDEFNNEAPYDFKHITSKWTYSDLSALTFSTGVGSFYGEEDASLTGESHNNKILPLCEKLSGKIRFKINCISFTSASYNCFISSGCQFIRMGDGTNSSSRCTNVKIESNCLYIGSKGISNITVGQNCSDIYLSDAKDVTVGQNCLNISFRQVDGWSTPYSYIQGVAIDGNCKYLSIGGSSSTLGLYLTNIHIHAGVQGTSSSILHLSLERDKSYTTDVYPIGSTEIFV